MSPAPLILTPRERLVVALDVPTAKEALAMAERLSGRVGMLKVGYPIQKGFIGYVQGDTSDNDPDYRIGIQWLPIPHLELVTEVRRTYGPAYAAPMTSGLVLLHHWL